MPYFILDENHNPQQVFDPLIWASWLETPGNTFIALSLLNNIRISTVVLGIVGIQIGETPSIFETMVFGGFLAEYQCRYDSYEEALLGHKEILALHFKYFNISNPG